MAGQRAFLFGVWVDADHPQIDPIVIEDHETPESATRRGISQHGDAGDYQYVATVAVDESGQILCTAEDLARAATGEPGAKRAAASVTAIQSGKFMVVGYYEGSNEAVTDSGPASSRDKAELATRQILKKRMRAEDYMYLGTIFVDRTVTVSFTVENWEQSQAGSL